MEMEDGDKLTCSPIDLNVSQKTNADIFQIPAEV